MQGWSPDFIPTLTQDAITQKFVDRILPINGGDAMRLAGELAQREGIFTGISGGATLAGAVQLCETEPDGAKLLAMLPDIGERYLSTPLFDGIDSDMNDEEWSISRSSPSARFDVPPPSPSPAAAAPASSAGSVDASAEVQDFVARLIADPDQPLLMFALEWCEFCWSLRKLFAHCRIPYRSVDLDSTAYQREDRGGQIRAVLKARTGSPTIPQVFIGGEHLGGCSDTMAAFKQGRLQALLRQHGVGFDESVEIDPESLLPGWLQRR